MTDYRYALKIARWQRIEESARLFVFSAIFAFTAAGLLAWLG